MSINYGNKYIKIAIIIPFFNGDEYIINCLDSIKYSGNYTIKVYIINNSNIYSDIHNIVQNIDWIYVYDANPGIGYSRANNIGAELAISEGADIIICTNQDIIFDKYCINELIRPFTENPDIHMTAPMNFVYNFDNFDTLFVKYYLSQCPNFIYDALYGTIKKYYEINYISGSCFAIRSSTIKYIGFFDPLYFMYAEDDDLCRRLAYFKKKIVLVPDAKVAHKHSNVSSDKELSNNIQRWKRKSSIIYNLKGLEESILYNILKVCRNMLWDYINVLAHFKLYKFLCFFVDDISTILKLKIILKTRARENKIKNNIYMSSVNSKIKKD